MHYENPSNIRDPSKSQGTTKSLSPPTPHSCYIRVGWVKIMSIMYKKYFIIT